MKGTLFIVATPIGNLSDITLRALETLKSVDLIIAEDTRVTKRLLSHYVIETPTMSYHQYSSENKKFQILNHLLEGKNIALVTDAGTPGLSDPGNELIDFLYTHCSVVAVSTFQKYEGEKAAQRLVVPPGTPEGASTFKPCISIVPVPGSSALTAAISICGFNMSSFTFIGYFPKKKKSKIIKLLMNSRTPLVYFDSPHRLLKNLQYLLDEVGDRTVFIVRELTKLHETHYRGPLSEAIVFLSPNHLKGEFTVIVEK